MTDGGNSVAACNSCGTANQESENYCTECGSISSSPSGWAPSGGAAHAHRTCQHCGNGMVATAVVCTACGSPVGKVKAKAAAVVLAVFLSFWSWLYTYRKNSWKFWLGLGLTILGFGLGPHGGALLILGTWMWAVIDNAVKPSSFYFSNEI